MEEEPEALRLSIHSFENTGIGFAYLGNEEEQ